MPVWWGERLDGKLITSSFLGKRLDKALTRSILRRSRMFLNGPYRLQCQFGHYRSVILFLPPEAGTDVQILLAEALFDGCASLMTSLIDHLDIVCMNR